MEGSFGEEFRGDSEWSHPIGTKNQGITRASSTGRTKRLLPKHFVRLIRLEAVLANSLRSKIHFDEGGISMRGVFIKPVSSVDRRNSSSW